MNKFCLRQFNENAGPARVEMEPQEFAERINEIYVEGNAILQEGYAPFCKHIIIDNFTSTKSAISQITPENQHLLMSDYESRTEKELAVLVRWFPKDKFELKIAKYLDIILYSKEQIQLEDKEMDNIDPDLDIDYEYGIVSIRAQNVDFEQPMQPITILRNALGKEHGGSGIPINKAKYLQAVEFWKNNALVR